ncbi:putative quinol monooxygenase [Stenotrophomonas acidaminiphila]|uniref:putative quinol monooxygenase n=1 Tax=Stenotrophomonas acidaminiphila TaxID=128780 RepID=UPI0028AC9BBC|nr:putative quinol monooxygenase [Stenotrophomonas acidaminiphila]
MKDVSRREFLLASAMGVASSALPSIATSAEKAPMYGLIGKIDVVPGQRPAVVAALLEGVNAMPGCLSYVVAEDPADANAIWVTEVWDSKEHHANSLTLPAVQDAIRRARPFITGFSEHVETNPVGGRGLVAAR